MTEQIVDIVEANMPCSSDVASVASAAGATAGESIARTTAQSVYSSLQSQVSANTSRIANLVAAPASAAGELTDIRVTADGETMRTAGDAVRTQVESAIRRIKHGNVTSDDCDDLNDLPNQSVATFARFAGVEHVPDGFDWGTVTTINSSTEAPGRIQICVGPVNQRNDVVPRIAWRCCWFSADRWSPWSIIDPAQESNIMAARKPWTLGSADIADLNDVYGQQIMTFGRFDNIANAPEGFPLGGTLITANGLGTGVGQVQMCVDHYGHLAYRAMWKSVGNWSPWALIDSAALQPPQAQWASIAMFERIAVIGDSYASGEIFQGSTYKDYYQLSWGQVLARRNGIECQNLSQGGLHTRSWLTKPYGLPLMQSSEPAQLYIIALGINDYGLGDDYVGSLDDIDPSNPDTNPDTFCGNYGRIIAHVRAHAPHAKIIVMTMANDTGRFGVLNERIRGIGSKLGLPVIEQTDDSFFTSAAYLNHMVHQHPTAVTYSGMACAIERLFARCATDNIDYFKNYIG